MTEQKESAKEASVPLLQARLAGLIEPSSFPEAGPLLGSNQRWRARLVIRARALGASRGPPGDGAEAAVTRSAVPAPPGPRRSPAQLRAASHAACQPELATGEPPIPDPGRRGGQGRFRFGALLAALAQRRESIAGEERKRDKTSVAGRVAATKCKRSARNPRNNSFSYGRGMGSLT